MSHSPTPWKARPHGAGVQDANRRPVCSISTNTKKPRAQVEADSRLLASAPELLAACRWLIAQFQGDSGTGDSHWSQFPEYVAALAAIAKAEGGDA